MESPSALKADTEALCINLQQLEEQLRAKTISFDEAQRLWNSTYRPKARLLAEAMLSYVPSGDPRIIVQSQIGDQRVIQSDAINCIEGRFSEELAAIQLLTIRDQLRKLANDLPTPNA